MRILHTMLAALTGVAWAFSVGRFLLATGWPVVLCFGYAAASADFTVVCTLVALNLSNAEREAQLADFGVIRTIWITLGKSRKNFGPKKFQVL